MGDAKLEAVKSNKISVAIRVRPFIAREESEQEKWVVSKTDLRPKDGDVKTLVWTYDHVFGQGTYTDEVYQEVVSPIVNKSFQGFNGTVLCYGQTSSGKTHTLYGSKTDKGIIALFSDHLFDQINVDEGRKVYIVKVGVIEIYNEKLTDLLNSENSVDIQYEKHTDNFVPINLEEKTVTSSRELIEVAAAAQQRRRTEETAMNKASSRSHTVLRVKISMADLSSASRDSDSLDNLDVTSSACTTAVLHFVDLAGSEKQSQTGAEGERLQEAIHINKSLMTLSNVINQLSGMAEEREKFQTRAATEPRKPPFNRFINFRDSKLTQLLKSTLNGEAYITMICNVTVANVSETKSTLEFASRAKNMKVQPKKNFSARNEFEQKVLELQQLLEMRDQENARLQKQLESVKLFTRKQAPFLSTPPTDPLDANLRRYSLCLPSRRDDKSLRKTTADNNLFKKPFSILNDEDDFMSAEDTTLHFQRLTEHRESEFIEKWSEQEVQTDALGLATPKNRKKQTNSDTPIQTLRMTNTILRDISEEDHSELKEKIEFLEEEIRTLRLNEAESRAAIEAQAAFNEKIEALTSEKITLEENIRHLEEDVIRQMEKSKENTQRLTSDFEAEKAKLFKNQAESRNRIISLEEEIKKLRGACDEKQDGNNDRIQELISGKAELELALTEADRNHSLLSTQLESLANVHSELKEKIEFLEEEIRTLRLNEAESRAAIEAQAAFNEKIEALTSEKINLEEHIRHLEEDVIRQTEKSKENTQRLTSDFEAEKAKLFKNQAESRNRIISLEEEIKKLRGACDEKNDRIQELISGKGELELALTEADRNHSLLSTQLESLANVHSELKVKIEYLGDENRSLRHSEAESRAAIEAQAAFNEKIEALTSEKMNLEEHIRHLEEDVIRQTEESKENTQRLTSDFEAEKAKLFNNQAESRNRIISLEEEIKKLRGACDEKNDRIQELISGKAELELVITEASRNHSQLSIQLESVSKDKENIQSRLDSLNAREAATKVTRGSQCDILQDSDVNEMWEKAKRYRDYSKNLEFQLRKAQQMPDTLKEKDVRIAELESMLEVKEQDIKQLNEIILDVPEPKVTFEEGVQCDLLSEKIVKFPPKPVDVGRQFTTNRLTSKPKLGFQMPANLQPHSFAKSLTPNQSGNHSYSSNKSTLVVHKSQDICSQEGAPLNTRGILPTSRLSKSEIHSYSVKELTRVYDKRQESSINVETVAASRVSPPKSLAPNQSENQVVSPKKVSPEVYKSQDSDIITNGAAPTATTDPENIENVPAKKKKASEMTEEEKDSMDPMDLFDLLLAEANENEDNRDTIYFPF